MKSRKPHSGVIVPARVAQNAKRRKRQLSEAELEQRRAAAPKGLAAGALAGKSTGPKTPEGKAAACRNGWKHGRYSLINQQRFGLGAASISKMFGKPCVTTCQFHPDNAERTEAPCSLVLDGMTRAGASCLDKTVYVTALDSLLTAMRDGEMEGMHGLLAVEMASNLQIVDQIRQAVSDHGIMTAVHAITKDGKVILNPETGKPLVMELKLNPALMALERFTATHGVNFGELMATPKARAKIEEDEDAQSTFHSVVGGLLTRMAGKLKQAPVIDHESGT